LLLFIKGRKVMESKNAKKMIVIGIIVIFLGTCFTPQMSIHLISEKSGLAAATEPYNNSCHCSEGGENIEPIAYPSPPESVGDKDNPSRGGDVFTYFEYVPQENNSNNITYTVDLGATFGDIIVCHLMTDITAKTIDLTDNIHFLIYSTPSSPSQILENYTCGNKSVQDVGRLHDSIYITTLAGELDTLEITLNAKNSYPRILSGSYVEIQQSNPGLSWGNDHGDWSTGPGVFSDPSLGGYLAQSWVFAHGYHASWKEFVEMDEFLRACSELSVFSYKEFSPIDTDTNRRATIFMRATWAGTMDVNSVSPTGAGLYGYIVGAGLAKGAPPPAGMTKWTRLTEGGDLTNVLGPSSTYIQEVVSTVAVSAIGEAYEEGLGVPFVDSIISVLQFGYALLSTDENSSGAKTIIYKDIKLDKYSSNYLWAGAFTRAQAAGTASAYVNFRWDGDPFLDGDVYDNHNKGVWLHNALIYYQPVEFPEIQMDTPVQDYSLIAQNDSISFSASVSKGDNPYTYQWFAESKNATTHNISSTLLQTETGVTKTTSSYSTHTLSPGKFSIVVKVTDKNGGSCSDLRSVEVLAPPPKPTIAVSQSTIPESSVYLVQWNLVDRIAYYVLQESTNNMTWSNFTSQTWLWMPFYKTTPLITYYYRVVPYNKFDRPGPLSNTVHISITARPLDAPKIKDLSTRWGSASTYGLHWQKTGSGIDYGYHVREYQWVNLTAANTPLLHKELISEKYWDENSILNLTDHVMYQNQTDNSWWFGYSFSHAVTEPTVYEYEVAHRRKIGSTYYDGNWSRNVSIEILPPPQYAPHLIQPIYNASRCVPYYVEWTYNQSDDHEFFIQEATDSSFTHLIDNDTNNRSTLHEAYQHTPTSTTTYYYRVRGKNIGGNGPWSNTVTKEVYGTTGVPQPPAPVLLPSTTTAFSGDTYSFTWNHIDPEGQYVFQEATDSGFGTITINIIFGGCGVIPQLNYSVSHTTTSTKYYYYRIKATAAYAQDSPWSDTIKVTMFGSKTQPAPLLHDPGTTIERFRAYTLSWAPVLTPSDIYLEESTDPLFSSSPQAWSVDGSRTDLYEDLWKDPLETTTYFYRMRVQDKNGVSPWSNTVDVQVLYPNGNATGWNIPSGRPTLLSPTNGSIVNSNNPIDITWTRVPGATFYIVEEAEFYPDPIMTPPQCQWWRSSWQVFNENGTNIMLNRQGTANKQLCYRVKAGNFAGLTMASNVSTVTLLPGANPGAPKNDSDSYRNALSLFIGAGSFPGRVILQARLTNTTFNNIFSTGGAQISVHDSQGTVYQSDRGIGNVIGASIGKYGFSNQYKIAKVETDTTVKVYNANGTINRTISGLKGAIGVCFGDFDGVGGVDLAISEYNMSNVTVYNKTGVKIRTITGLSGPCGMAIGDFNNDGANDIAIAQEPIGKVTVFNKTGSIIQEFTDLVRPQSVTLQDENHDGIQDLAIGTADGTVHVYFGVIDHRNGIANESVYDPYGTIPSGQCLYRPIPDESYSDFCDITQQVTLVKLIGLGTSIGDFNNDGSNELAIIFNMPKVRVYSISSTNPISASNNITGLKDVAIGDFDNDHMNEVAVSTPSMVYVYETNNWYTPITEFPTTDARSVFIGDFNDDGLKELAVSQNNRVSIYGPGSGHPLIKEITGLTNPQGIQIFDFNNDGHNDVGVFDNYGGGAYELKVYMQQNRPTRPTVISPLNNATNVAVSADLSWVCGDPDIGDTVTYDVYFGTDPTPLLVTSQYAASSYDPGTLAYDTTYYWQIVAHDTHGLVTPGPVWKFSTKANTPPTIPSNPTPASGLTNASVFETFTWSCADVDSEDTVTYDVYLGTNPTQLTKLSTQQTQASYTPQSLNYSTMYYWMIVAHDTYGHILSGPIWSFTTEYTLAQGFWHLNEGTGSIAHDATTYHNNGTITGATWTTGKYGHCLYFDGNGDFVTIPHSSSLNITQPFTVEAWVNLTTDATSLRAIVDKYQYINSHGYGFTLYTSDLCKPRFTVYGGAGGTVADVIGTTVLNDNRWHHIAGVCNGTHVCVYVDGIKEADALSSITPASLNQPVIIGRRPSSGISDFKGRIDEVRISTWKHIPTKPYNPSPANNTQNNQLNPQLQVTVNDPDKDTLTAVWYTNVTGSWQLFATNYNIVTTSGPVTIQQTPTMYSQYLTKYWWKLLVTDGVYESNSIFKMTTLADTVQPNISLIQATPRQQQTGRAVNITANVFDLGGVQTVKVNITSPLGSWVNQTMSKVADHTQYCWNTTYATNGIYYYKIYAKDQNGNAITSGISNFTIGYLINLISFPMYTAAATPGFHQMCGPAVLQMALNYMWWNSTLHPSGPPMKFNDQTWLYNTGRANNSNTSLPYLDAKGMWTTLQTYLPKPYFGPTGYGYNFDIDSNTNQTFMIRQICEWINYTIGSYGGHQQGYPLHVPSLVPTYGNYSNWMAVRGIITNQPACPLPAQLTVYGFWVNDPYPASLGGLGENSYKTITQWNTQYYKTITSNDIYNGKYVAICEPPETKTETSVTMAVSPARFSDEQKLTITETQINPGKSSADVTRQVNQWILKAAVTGVTEQLIPYDADFASAFAKTIPGTPLLIRNLNGTTYYLIPFILPFQIFKPQFQKISQDLLVKNTIVVVLIDATDGSFKEASWVKTPVKYLPLSKSDAQKLVIEKLKEQGIVLKDPSAILIDLVYRQSSPYYPEWRITIQELGRIFFVSQDGAISTI
jgi:hypothetical protein